MLTAPHYWPLYRFVTDSNDFVLRFNNAPVAGYENDVGKRTDLRILNSQILSKMEFHFLNSTLYKDVNLLVWDPSNYSSTIKEVCPLRKFVVHTFLTHLLHTFHLFLSGWSIRNITFKTRSSSTAKSILRVTSTFWNRPCYGYCGTLSKAIRLLRLNQIHHLPDS